MKAALIGLGMVAKTYGDAFRNSGNVRLSHVFARNSDRRSAFLSDWPDLGAAAAASIGEIAASDADFVILTTPPDARKDIVEALCTAGKPILMEKPVERNLINATALVEHCEAASVPLGIVLQHRARPVVADLRRILPSFGTLQAVEINIPWWRPQSYYDAPGRGDYARDGGGVLITQAIHTLDLALSLTGPVREVTAMSATTKLHRMESEDFVSAGLIFANGAVGQLFASTASYPGRGETITLHCSAGSARLEAGQLNVDWHDGRTETLGEAAASGAGADPMAFTSDWHRFVIENFAAALQEKRPPLATGRSALEVHRLIDALECSAKAKTAVALEDL